MDLDKIVFFSAVSSPATLNAAIALNEAGLLGAYRTTLAFREDGLVLRAARAIDGLFNLTLSRELGRRAAAGLPGRVVHGFPWIEGARTVVERSGASGWPLDALSKARLIAFDKHVAKRLGPHPAVYGFRGAAAHTFAAAKARGGLCVYSVGGLEPDYVAALRERELALFPGLRDQIMEPPEANDSRQAADAEWALADLIIFNSQVALESHRSAGLDVSKGRVVPLGFPEPIAPVARAAPAGEGPLKVLWAGNFSMMKGAHHLLAALEMLHDKQIEVRVFGRRMLRDTGRLDVRPTVPRAELMEAYRQADVLVLPTLSDGFGMVVSEAMSQGLAVITTPRAGAAEFIETGRNGLIVSPSDPPALAAALSWCADNRAALRDMGEAARLTAASWQWSDFRRALAGAVAAAIEERRRRAP